LAPEPAASGSCHVVDGAGGGVPVGAGIVQAEQPDTSATGPAGKKWARGFAGPVASGGLGVSRPHQKRIEALTNRLQEKGFFIKQVGLC
jgi:hypothetical protein